MSSFSMQNHIEIDTWKHLPLIYFELRYHHRPKIFRGNQISLYISFWWDTPLSYISFCLETFGM